MKKTLRNIFLSGVAFLLATNGVALPLDAAHAQSTNSGGQGSHVTTLPPDLVNDTFAVVGGQIRYTPNDEANSPNTESRRPGDTLAGNATNSQNTSPSVNTPEGRGNSILNSIPDSGQFAIAWIDWGTSASLEKSSQLVILEFESQQVKDFRVVLNDLRPNTTYHYRASALTVFGVDQGSTLTFTTNGVGDGNYELSASPTQVMPNNNITVHFETPNAVNSQLDWIGMYRVGANDRDYRHFEYTDGRHEGDITFEALEPGIYEFRYFTNNSFSRAAVSNRVTVSHPNDGEYELQASPETVAPGSQVTVTFTTPGGSNDPKDWIAMYPVNAADHDYITFKYTDGDESGTLTFTAPQDEGDYNFRYFIRNGYNRQAISNTIHVSDDAQNDRAPEAVTKPALAISSNAAQLNGMVDPNGSHTTAWFEWGTSNANLNNTTQSQSIGSGDSSLAVFKTVTGLQNNTTYYYRVVAQNSYGTDRGSIVNFTTTTSGGGDGNAPQVTTKQATNITETGATLLASINPRGRSTTAWFVWGTNSNQLNNTTTKQSMGSGSSDQELSRTLSGLQNDTTYYYRAVAQNSAGTTDGAILSFTAGDDGNGDGNTPLVTTQSATNIEEDGATLRAQVNPRGSNTTVWFNWGTNSNQLNNSTTPSQSVGSGNANVSVTKAITGLTSDTQYYYRAVAQNSFGTQMGSVMNFTTDDDGIGGEPGNGPDVQTKAASEIKNVSMKLNGSVNPNGLATVSWFEWGTSSSTLSQLTPEKSAGSGTAVKNVNHTITGLSANTTYYFRIAGRNSEGTSRGSVLSARTGSTNGGGNQGTYTLQASPATITVGGSVTVHFEAQSTSANSVKDWVGMYRVGDNDHTYRKFLYTNGAESGDLTFEINQPGVYEFRYFLDNGYTLKATSNSVVVMPEGDDDYSLTARPSSVRPGHTIAVDFTTPNEGSRGKKDWVGLYRTDADDHTFVTWKYTNGVSHGTMYFSAPMTEGDYEFRYFVNNGYTRVADSNTVNVSQSAEIQSAAQATDDQPGYAASSYNGQYSLEPSTQVLHKGELLMVSYSAPTDQVAKSDWVGLYQVGQPDNKATAKKGTKGKVSDNVAFRVKKPGTYEFRYFKKEGRQSVLVAQSSHVIVEDVVPVGVSDATDYTVRPSTAEVKKGGIIIATFEGPAAPENKRDFIGLYLVGNADNKAASKKGTKGRGAGAYDFKVKKPGTYEFRYYTIGTDRKPVLMATSDPFTVTE